jgi:hypothetical protein
MRDAVILGLVGTLGLWALPTLLFKTYYAAKLDYVCKLVDMIQKAKQTQTET